ncbi:MAG: transglutaminase family protein [Oscillospiraceae bacterium]|nr:transglutaminase family protein [Oscillospiraceae bacterium]
MKAVNFQYRTELVFSSPASDHKFLLKILPQDDGRQRIASLSWLVEPQGKLWRVSDGFGNAALAGYIDPPHSRFRFGITGTAEVSDKPYVICPEPERALLYPSELTKPRGGISDFYDRLKAFAPPPDEPLRRAEYFSRAVHGHMNYERGITGSSTPAREAFALGSGVCQDYAHILLALLKLDKIPCRYVAGLASDCGETHAWVEAWANGKFYGIDPTRDKFTDESYVALSRGRDFKDCSVERGTYKGACKGSQTITLSMEDAEVSQ